MSDIFVKIQDNKNIKQSIKDTFNVDLDVSGGWGYDKSSALIVHSLNVKDEQFYQLFASIRATIELNILKEKEDKYAGINPSIKSILKEENHTKVIFHITAIKQNTYNELIKEYKQGYGKKDFDIQAHFEKRKKATLKLEMTCWFLMEGK
ncbi:MAG: hypothetical protein CR967_02970 [Proteobacteria bacterium]|nr:MAG: hypothetical protein CR967_02970 [Pseudomonadota bacterium]